MRLMEELETYSIETDHTVLLSFRNGRKRRVAVERLPQYLRSQDLHIVERAMKLRRDFIRSHMPKAALLLLAAGLLTLLAVNSRSLVARLFGHSSVPGSSTIVHSQLPPAPGTQPAPSSPGATPRLTRPRVVHAAAGITLVAKHAVAPAADVTGPAVTPQPSASPAIQPSPSPTPSTSPEPSTATNQPASSQPAATPAPASEPGQVLGDATGPATP
jgi:hypothetical protein